MKLFLRPFILIGILTGILTHLTSFAQASELGGILKNNAGVQKFSSEKSSGAYGDFTGALSDLPYEGAVHFNLGNAFLKNHEFEKALSEYAAAGQAAKENTRFNLEIRFRSYFNAAVAQTELKKNDEALQLYQQALGVHPDSKEAKTNMELLSKSSQGQGKGDDQDKKDDKDNEKDKKDKKDDKKNDKDDKKDDKSKDDKKDDKPKDPEKFDNPKPSPKPFKSEDLTQQDVKRILEELKRQEEQIRGRMENEQRKSAPPGKDW